ncbi:MAG: HD domain-containing protein [Ruminococcaceae bacterium]|nr:HD domain-containing protein [Oscillospiraceae bacterium]
MTDNIIFDTEPTLITLKDEISLRISDKYRLEHTLSVANECLALADIFALSEYEKKQIAISALLHDIAKGLSPDEFKALDEKYSVGFTDDDFASPAVLHAKAGAKIAELEFARYADERVCKAIEAHTTGGENMSLMAKLLFIADYIEPTRRWDICKETRSCFYSELKRDGADIFKVLDRTVIKILDQTAKHLEETGRPVHPDSVKCKDFILKTIE